MKNNVAGTCFVYLFGARCNAGLDFIRIALSLKWTEIVESPMRITVLLKNDMDMTFIYSVQNPVTD